MPFELRADQRRALRALRHHFVDLGNTRGKYISACGTGKTVVLAHLPEVLDARSVVFFVPSLNLVEQTWKAFDRQLAGAFDGFIVCSDDTRGQTAKNNPRKRHHGTSPLDESDSQELTDDEIAALVGQSGRGAVLRDPLQIADRLDQAPLLGPPTIVFCTYQSSHLLRQGVQRSAAGQVDLVICDEAHRLASEKTGQLRSGTVDALQYPPRVVLKLLKAKRRVFATATPKSSATPGAYGMDDTALFGEDAHVYTYAQAVLDGVVAPFDIVVSHLDADAVGEADFMSRLLPSVRSPEPGMTGRSLVSHEDVRSMVVARTVAALRAAGTVERVLTYSSSIQRAERNAADIQAVEPGVGVAVSSKTPRKKRIRAIEGLSDGSVPVLANCRLFGEGHDAPSLDAVAFCDPKGSVVDIAQAIGRAARIPVDPSTGLPVEDKRALVILPVDSFCYDQRGTLVRRADGKGAVDVEAARQRSSDSPFAVVQAVLNALDTPGIALHDCAGDFSKALSNRFVFGRVEPVATGPKGSRPSAPTSNVRNHTGMSSDQLDALIGKETADERSRVYTEDEMLAAAPRVLTLNALDPDPAAMAAQSYTDARAALVRYVVPEKVDKTEVFDFSIPWDATAMSVARQYAMSGSLLGSDPAAVLWRAVDQLSTPVLRRRFCSLVASRPQGSAPVVDIDGSPAFAGFDPGAITGIEPGRLDQELQAVGRAVAYAVYLGETGSKPGTNPARAGLVPPRLRQEAENADRAFARRLSKGLVTQTERLAMSMAGY